MKIGLGLYRESLTPDNFRFARQAGATHIVAHLTNYFRGRDPCLSAGTENDGWGDCSTDKLWTYEDFAGLVKTVRDNGLELAAIENFSPRFWSDVLLGGPERATQIEGLKRLVRDAGRAGIPCIGYNFSIAGVWGWSRGPVRARRGDVGRPRPGGDRSRPAAARRRRLEHALSAGPRPAPTRSRSAATSFGSGSAPSCASSCRSPRRPASCWPRIPTIRRPRRCAGRAAGQPAARNTTG